MPKIATPKSEPMQQPTVRVVVDIPSSWDEPLLKALGLTYRVDGLKLSLNPAAAKHLFLYGVSRFAKDGCTPDDEVTEGETKRPATDAERKAQALELTTEKFARLFSGTLRQRVGGTADPVLAELRTIVVKALVKRGVARKAIPKLPDRKSIEAACAAHDGLFAKALALATKVVAARGDEL